MNGGYWSIDQLPKYTGRWVEFGECTLTPQPYRNKEILHAHQIGQWLPQQQQQQAKLEEGLAE